MESQLKEITIKLSSVTVFRAVCESEVIKKLLKFFKSDKLTEEKIGSYCDFVSSLYKNGCDLGKYLLKQVLEDENEYVILCAKKEEIPSCMKEAVKKELEFFTELSKISSSEFAKAFDGLNCYIPSFDNTEIDFEKSYSQKIERLFKDGYGIYSKYTMFNLRGGEITPLKSADNISVLDLIGYENERKKVIDNTKALIDGKPAANILLCGDAGTGKSSTVKAVTNMFAKDGIRLIEVQKEQLMSLPVIMEEIAHNPLKFIIFIDDLSFNKAEDGFGTLKAILEGSASAKANNAVIYATSNRRHLVKESFSDRDGDDIHRNDTMQELLSLSERFGLTIQFSKPNKDLYLRIVKNLSDNYGLDYDENDICLKAEAFALRKGGRSARTAKQFVQSLL